MSSVTEALFSHALVSFSAQEIADMSGVPVAAIDAFFKYYTIPRESDLVRIADAVGFEHEGPLGGSGPVGRLKNLSYLRARREGLKLYTGKPCWKKHGGVSGSVRYTSNHTCVECAAVDSWKQKERKAKNTGYV